MVLNDKNKNYGHIVVKRTTFERFKDYTDRNGLKKVILADKWINKQIEEEESKQ